MVFGMNNSTLMIGGLLMFSWKLNNDNTSDFDMDLVSGNWCNIGLCQDLNRCLLKLNRWYALQFYSLLDCD